MVRLTSEQEMIQKMVKEFADRELLPISKQIDSLCQYPKEILQKVSPLGLMGLFIPQEYGGAGADTVSYVLSIEEIGKACAAVAMVLAVHNSLVCGTINRFGTDDQKKKYLTQLAQGKLGGFALPDKDKATATLEGDGYLISGSKKHVLNGGEADYYIVFAELDGKEKGFIVPADSDGLSLGEVDEGVGLKGAGSRPSIFSGVRVPRENLIEGDNVASYALDEFRIALAAISVGICEASLEQSIQYSMERNQFGFPICVFQGLRWKLARMHEKAQTSRLLALEAARARDEGLEFSDRAQIAKLYASEAATWVSKQGVLIHGGTGYTKEVPLERFARDARAMPLIGGTNEEILDSIAARLFE
jgi:butyryl-CoA dehydrogenase